MRTIASDLREPAGVAFRDGALYVSAVSRILRFDDIERRLDNPPQPVVVTDALPDRRPSRPQVHRVRARRQAVRAGRRAVQHLRARSRSLREHHAHESRRQRPRGRRARHPQHRRLRLGSAHAASCGSRQRPRHARRRRAARRAQPRDAAPASISAIRTATAERSPTRSSARKQPCSEFAPPAQNLGPARRGARHALLHRQRSFPRAYRNADLHRRARLVEPQPQDRLSRHGRDARRRGKAGRVRAVRRRLAAGRAGVGPARRTCSSRPTARCWSPTTRRVRSTGSATAGPDCRDDRATPGPSAGMRRRPRWARARAVSAAQPGALRNRANRRIVAPLCMHMHACGGATSPRR